MSPNGAIFQDFRLCWQLAVVQVDNSTLDPWVLCALQQGREGGRSAKKAEGRDPRAAARASGQSGPGPLPLGFREASRCDCVASFRLGAWNAPAC